jgi:hypothetical protein
MPTNSMPNVSDEHRRRIECIAISYRKLTGRELIGGSADVVAALWSAPEAIVAHGTEPDPIFFFGNETALRLFECDFATFTRLPSRLSAEPLLREERAHLLERVTKSGIISDYAGIRVSSTGRRFRIANASVWNLTGEEGAPAGQAAAFADWTPIT